MRRTLVGCSLLGLVAAFAGSASAQVLNFGYAHLIETWTVPTTGTYTILAAGAVGGRGRFQTSPGGNGALIGGDIALTAGTSLSILVGGYGRNTNNPTGNGGGGTFVALNGVTPLVIAGGGGGGGAMADIIGPGQHGQATRTTNSLIGGVNGNGGIGQYSGGGGGFFGDGLSLEHFYYVGRSFLNGGEDEFRGGFGGGGGGGSTGSGGGGGGYCGGGGNVIGEAGGGGGGGSSYLDDSALNPILIEGGNVGYNNHGYVTITFILPSCPSSFATAVNYAAGNTPRPVAIGDLNGDGRPDLATGDNGGTVMVRLGNGDGSFFAAPVLYLTGGGDIFAVAIGDLNGDGRPDLAVSHSSGGVSVMLGNGPPSNGPPSNGTFGAAVGYAAGDGPRGLAIGDLNGDGRPDLAVANRNTNNVSVLLGNGPPNSGTFATAVNYATGSRPSSVAIGDFNADGRPDLAVTNQIGNTVAVLLASGPPNSGTFAAPVTYTAGTGPFSVAAGDFNGDGRLDLAVANVSSDFASVLRGNGDGTFAAPVNYIVGSGSQSVAIGDVNGDSRPDLALLANGGVSVLLGNSTGTFAAPVNYGAGASSTSVAIGDLNRDGRPDLAVANQGSDNVSVLINTSPSVGIGTHPQNQTVAPGANADFTVTVTGDGPFTYQWRRDGVPINGATAGTLTINNVTEANAGAYDVQVRGGCNPTAVATSYPAVLTVQAPCLADINHDGLVTSQDFFDFLTAFFNNDLAADINHDMIVTSQDFFDFVAAFFTGCP